MLKGIPKILSPELLKTLCEMGHGEVLCIADGNFPAGSVGKNSKIIRADGLGAAELLDAILTVFPLDTYVATPVMLMALTEGDRGKVKTPIWDEFRAAIAKHDPRGGDTVGFYERFEFYKEAEKSYAIVATGEQALYGNILLRKGVVT